MNSCTCRSIRFAATLLGAFLLNLPCGLPLYIGNLSVYYLSYITEVLKVDGATVSPWVMSIFDLAQAAGTIIAGFLPHHISNRWMLILGTAIMSSGLFSCYYTVQTSPVLLMLTLAVLPGIGSGISRLMAITILFTWSKGNKGFFASVAPTAFGIGAIFFNQFITRYVNPESKVPVDFGDFGDSTKYFNQPEILKRVPLLFIYLGAFTVLVQLTGSFLLNEREESQSEKKDILTSQNSDRSSQHHENIEEVPDNNIEMVSSYGTNANGGEDKASERDFNPKQLLSKMLFYVLLFLFVSSKQQGLVFYTYYKLYGQTWIENDYFLTNLGTVISFIVMVARPLWGVIVDKVGIKPVTVFIFSIGGIIFCWIYVSKYFDKWMFVVACATIASVHCACIIIFPVLVSEFFGKRNFAKNFGLLMFIEASLNIATPAGIILILHNFEWFALYAYIGTIISIAAFFSLRWIPNKK